MKIFISHSSKDRELVKKFTYLLETAFMLNSKEIYCTSLYNRPNIGEDYITNIRNNLRDAEVVFFLITENYVNSNFCLMELGASWAFKDNLIPILVPPVSYDFINNTPLRPIQTGMINNENDIHDIYKKLVEKNVIERLDLEKEIKLWEKFNNFKTELNDLINSTNEEIFETARYLTVTQNGDAKGLTISNDFDGISKTVSLSCNFKPNKLYPIPSSFVSFVLQYYPFKNFIFSAENYALSFYLRSENEDIANVIVEIKSGNRLIKVVEEQFDVVNKWQKYNIDLKKVKPESLKEVAEICFVIKPNFTQELSGTLDIRNICLEVIK